VNGSPVRAARAPFAQGVDNSSTARHLLFSPGLPAGPLPRRSSRSRLRPEARETRPTAISITRWRSWCTSLSGGGPPRRSAHRRAPAPSRQSQEV